MKCELVNSIEILLRNSEFNLRRRGKMKCKIRVFFFFDCTVSFIYYTVVTRRQELEKAGKMNKKQFLLYFKKKEKVSDPENSDDVKITNVVTSATKDITNAELTLVEDEIQKSCSRPVKYQKAIPEKIKKEVGIHGNIFGTASAIKTFSIKYKKYTFNRTTVNSWKAKCKNTNAVFKKAGRPNLLDDNLIKKVKDIASGTRAAGGVINRKQILNIAKGVVTTNNPNALKQFGGTVELTDRWARHVLTKLEWSKRKGTTGKVEPSPQFLAEEKFTFQRAISAAVRTRHPIIICCKFRSNTVKLRFSGKVHL